MTDKQFQRYLDALSKAQGKYKKLLNACELEYQRRYGRSPSDADDDGWIDTFHVVGGTRTVEEVDHSARHYADLDGFLHNKLL